MKKSKIIALLCTTILSHGASLGTEDTPTKVAKEETINLRKTALTQQQILKEEVSALDRDSQCVLSPDSKVAVASRIVPSRLAAQEREIKHRELEIQAKMEEEKHKRQMVIAVKNAEIQADNTYGQLFKDAQEREKLAQETQVSLQQKIDDLLKTKTTLEESKQKLETALTKKDQMKEYELKQKESEIENINLLLEANQSKVIALQKQLREKELKQAEIVGENTILIKGVKSLSNGSTTSGQLVQPIQPTVQPTVQPEQTVETGETKNIKKKVVVSNFGQ